ncbi:metal ABC transporter permease [Bacillus timonensis]|nr:metal ABC transporter permease [Bacillus timonensis]
MNTLISLLSDANTQWVVMGTLLLGLASGVLGSFALLRKQSLIGDAMAHAALPGICIAFLLYGAKSMTWFMVGAALAGLVATYFIHAIVKYSRIKEDTSIGLVLSVFFGFGITLLTLINHNFSGNQSGLDDFIFGQAASLVGLDVKIISGVAITLLIITFLLFKELKLLTFDPQFAKGIGLPTGILNSLLMTLIVGAVVVGLQAVGVILMAAMLITPAIAARYWTERLDRMVLIAGGIGATSGVLGTLLSTITRGMPTGPLIIMAATIMFLISLLFAPQRGLLSKAVRHYRVRKITAREQVIQTIYDVIEDRLMMKNSSHKLHFSEQQILKRRSLKQGNLRKQLYLLQVEGIISNVADNTWMLTEKGINISHEITLKNRLFEMYLMNEMKYAHLNLKDSASSNILEIPTDVLGELKALLTRYNCEPQVINILSAVNNKQMKYKKGGQRTNEL